MGKVLELNDLALELDKVRANKTIVHCHGVYDLIHAGHVQHLDEAKGLGDILVVTLTSDKYVNKGPGRPINSEHDRAVMLAALEVVDLVAISDFENAVSVINFTRPNIYVKGPDYKDSTTDLTGNIEREEEAVKALGGSIHFTSGRTMSSSSLINKVLINESREYSQWLGLFREKYSESDLLGWLDKAAQLKVLIIGEAILDDYISCEALGKSSKDPVLAFRKLGFERQLGGSLAIAKHASGLAASTSVIFRVNSYSGELPEILSKLPGAIQALALESKTEPTIVKTRYVDSLTSNKVFETYQIGEGVPSRLDASKLQSLLAVQIEKYDLVVVADYGHGLLDGDSIKFICQNSRYLAVNTQSNAGNRGFNSISKYSKVDFACLNGGEISLEVRQRHVTVEALVPELLSRTNSTTAIVTNGSKGLAFASKNSGSGVVPGFASKVKDRVGAGDALFVTSALLLAAGAPAEVAGLFGNLAGAASIADLGNRVSVSRANLQRHAVALLK